LKLKYVKIRFLLLGTLIGIALGSITVYLIDEFNLPVIEKIKYVTLPVTYIKNIAKPLFTSDNKDTSESSKEKPGVKSLTEHKDTLSDKDISTLNDSLNNADADNEKIVIDSDKLPVNTALSFETDDKKIVFMKDKLIYTKKILIDDINMINENALDNKLSGLLTDNKSNNNKQQNLIIEFWKSPVNYEGYKMSNNTLVIYGIEDFELANFIYFNNSLFLDFLSNYYHLENCQSFKPLVKIANAKLIEELNKSKVK
jgi:hypothetical protein